MEQTIWGVMNWAVKLYLEVALYAREVKLIGYGKNYAHRREYNTDRFIITTYFLRNNYTDTEIRFEFLHQYWF